MEALVRDLRLALRSAARQPWLTAVVVLTLALGIGANTAIFSTVRSVLLAPLDYAQPDRLVTVWQDHSELGGPQDEWFSWDNFNDTRQRSTTFANMAAIGGWLPTLTDGELAEELQGAAVSWTAFEVLGRQPVMGRAFGSQEDASGGEPVLLLSDGLWKRRYGGDPGIIGQTIQLQGMESWRVIGVLPPGFELPFAGRPEVLRPLGIDATNSCGRGCVNLRVVGRLADGHSLGQAREELASIAEQLAAEFPAANTGVGSHLVPLHERVTGQARTPLALLFVAVGLVLLIAGANIAGLQLTRALRRRHELALRAALGADRWQIVRQLLAESLVLAILGGAAGLAVAVGGIQLLQRWAINAVPRLADASLDSATLVFALALTLLTGLTVGLLPALRSSRLFLHDQLKQRGGSRQGERTRSALVVAEVALATLLLIGAGLLSRSLLHLFHLDLGYSTEHTLLARVGLGGGNYSQSESRWAFSESVLERLRANPGVVAASHTNAPPLLGFDMDANFTVDGRPAPQAGQGMVGWVRSIDHQYLETLRVPLVAGRGFTAADREGALDVVLINESAAKRYFSDGPAIGQRINFNSQVRWREIVGVVADTRHFGLTEPERPAIYVPYQQSPFGSPYFVVRAQGDPMALVSLLRAAVGEHDANLAVAGVERFEQVLGDATTVESMLVALLGAFSACALLLASLGLYGVMSHAVEQRRRELGIRLALGADGSRLRAMVLRGGLLLVAIGLAGGLLGAAGLGRFLSSVLHGVSPWDGTTFLLVPLVLGLVAATALWLPARRAARTEVLTVLRSE